MTANNPMEMRLHLTPEQERRRAFLISLKRFANIHMQDQVRRVSADQIEPQLERGLDRPLSPTSREDRGRVRDALTPHPLYRAWEALTYSSQDMMWELAGDIVDSDMPRLRAAAIEHTRPQATGSLRLDPELALPRYIANHEIHRQPGGFTLDRGDGDLTAGAFYLGAGLVYGPGKHPGNKVGYGAGHFILNELEQRYPDFQPQAVLDVGCAVAANTLTYGQRFPDAELYGIDCAPAFLRFAHALAESEGVTLHLRQMNAEQMSFPDRRFDLVVSHIVGHETSPRALPRVLAECWRVLRPGGVAIHMDVPTQIARLPLADQVMNDWQVRHNGEHFWTGWAEADVRTIMLELGYPEENLFAEHVQRSPSGPVWFVHGVRKPND